MLKGRSERWERERLEEYLESILSRGTTRRAVIPGSDYGCGEVVEIKKIR